MKKLLLPAVLAVATLLAILGGVGWFGQPRAAEGEQDSTASVTSVFRVEGMTCGGCEIGVQLAVGKLDGVASVDASFEQGTATVVHDAERVTPEEIVAAVDQLGYEAELSSEPEGDDEAGDG